MSQIGEGKTMIEGLGRLLGNGDGKAARLAAGLGGGGREEFARLMASAQGRIKTDGETGTPRGADASSSSELAPGSAVRGSEAFEQALAGLADQLAQLREALGGRSNGGGPGAKPTAAGEGLRSSLDELVGELERRIASLDGESVGNGTRAGDQTRTQVGMTQGGAAEMGIGQAGAWTDARAAGPAGGADRLAPDSSSLMGDLSDRIEELGDALARFNESIDAGQARPDAAWEGVMERLANLREGLADAGEQAGEMLPGLLGQLQALEQAVRRAESAVGGEARVAQGLAGSRGEGSSAWDGFWRFAENGRRPTGLNESARLAGGAGGDAPRDGDWSGGPVSAALGLTGRESIPMERERAPLTRWSALSGLEGHQARAEAELDAGSNATTSTNLTGLGGSPAGTSSAGGPGTGVFTGQAAAGTPNPQMPAQLGQQVQWMVGKGISKASIELRPADLGPLKIAIETQGDETRIALTATNATAQALLEQQLPRLKEWLQEAGLADSEVEVGLGQESDFGQQLADADEGGRGDANGADSESAEGGEAGQAVMADGSDAAGELGEGRLVLDLFA
ncbi:MAG: flagellar hook-length control protein FliK [Guyparkeria sp.]